MKQPPRAIITPQGVIIGSTLHSFIVASSRIEKVILNGSYLEFSYSARVRHGRQTYEAYVLVPPGYEAHALSIAEYFNSLIQDRNMRSGY